MNKRIALLCAVVMIVSLGLLTGCHEKYDLAQLAKEDAEQNPQYQTVPLENEEVEESNNEETAEAGNSSTESESTETSEPAPNIPPDTILGKTTDSSYSNSFFGIKFTRPNNDWYLATDAELAEVMNLKSSGISDEKILEVLQNSGYVMDLYTLDTSGSNSNTFDNINVTIEDIGKMYGVLLSEQELAQATLDSAKTILSDQGYSNVTAEVTEEVFAGSPRVCISYTGEKSGTKMFQKQIYIKKESYIACITVASFEKDRTGDLLTAFKAI